MKKFVLCISLLSSVFCAVGMAQATDNLLNIAGLEPTTNGKVTYYLKNVGTGLYMSYGGEWGTHCIETQQAHPIVVEDNGDGTIAIGSIGGYLESNTLWMDSTSNVSKWTLVKVEGYVNQYYLYGDGNRVLTSVGNSAGLLSLNTLNNTAMQRWIFTNGEDIKKSKMPNASEETPFDVTVSIRGGAFDLVDGWEQGSNKNVPAGIKNSTSLPDPYFGNWENYAANSKWIWDCGIRDWDPNAYAWCGIINGGESALNVTYSMTLPKGSYHFSFEGFYKYMKVVSKQSYSFGSPSGEPTITTSDNGRMTATVAIAGKTFTLASHTDNDIYDNGVAVATVFRNNDDYKHKHTFYLEESTTISIVISKAKTTATTTSGNKFLGTYTTTSYPNQIYIDDFTLLYYGEEDVTSTLKENANYTSYLNANIAEYKSALNEEGLAAFNEAFAGVDVDAIDSRADYYDIIAAMERANDAGVVAHIKAEALKDALTSGNFSKLIVNNSFEKGDLTGWSTPDVWVADKAVYSNSIENYKTQGVDGSYLFNTWWQGVPITQAITGLPNGVYRMSVLVASGDINGETGEINDGTVYLLANDKRLGVNPPSGGKTFGDFSIKFEVTDGTATIGVVGGADDDTPENSVGSYVEGGHWWYKCDNFRLEYLGEDHLVLEDTHKEAVALDHWYASLTLKRTIKPNTWSTFVVPFDIPANMLEGWEVKVLASSTYNAETGHISLVFSDAEDGIKAGVPYMVRNTTMDSNLDEISMTDVTINTEPKNTSTDYVEFVGTYTKMDIPEGAFFISSNQFWYAKDGSNTTKAFRAYMKPTVANARAMNYRMGGTTAIDDAQLTNDNEVTVVGIYTLGGVRISEMQEGVNILQMSDGSVVKVVIK